MTDKEEFIFMYNKLKDQEERLIMLEESAEEDFSLGEIGIMELSKRLTMIEFYMEETKELRKILESSEIAKECGLK